MLAGCFGSSTEDNTEMKNCSTPLFDSNNIEDVWSITGDYRTFSSPHVADLTGDGILDIVFGTGMEVPAKGSIIAIDGNNGAIIWNVKTSQEMFASAQFEDLDADGELDVILGGRGHELRAIDGQTGDIIWSFDSNSTEREKWYQFYTGQFIHDVNNDGTADWLTANGGDPTKTPEQDREGGYLMILSGSTGDVLAVADTPDGMETYVSPIVYKPSPTQETMVLFGTGGETWHGSLWSTSLEAILSGNISGSKEIVSPIEGIEKGLISPPVIVDLTMDGIQDIVVSMFDGRTIAINGTDFSTIWEVDAKQHALEGTAQSAETWITPAVGFFSQDSIPDVFVHYLIGEWPQYSTYWTAQIDGETGMISWMEETDHVSAASPLAVDLNGDSIDEVVMVRGTVLMNENNPNDFELSHELLIWNSCDFTSNTVFSRSGMSIASPLIIDIDGDGYLDMISTSTSSFDSPTGTWNMYRTNLNVPTPNTITWGAYMGTQYDGMIQLD
jgi:outer membrane protein assembly factor BamB